MPIKEMRVSRQNKTRHALTVFTNRLFTCGLPRLAYKVPRTIEDMPSRHQLQRGPEGYLNMQLGDPFYGALQKKAPSFPPLLIITISCTEE